MTIPAKHRALSSGALAPGAGTPHGAERRSTQLLFLDRYPEFVDSALVDWALLAAFRLVDYATLGERYQEGAFALAADMLYTTGTGPVSFPSPYLRAYQAMRRRLTRRLNIATKKARRRQ